LFLFFISAEISSALCDASVQLMGDAADSTAKVIEHKYGSEIGSSARDGLQVVFPRQASFCIAEYPYLGGPYFYFGTFSPRH
jgi:hypothetical protein